MLTFSFQLLEAQSTERVQVALISGRPDYLHHFPKALVDRRSEAEGLTWISFEAVQVFRVELDFHEIRIYAEGRNYAIPLLHLM